MRMDPDRPFGKGQSRAPLADDFLVAGSTSGIGPGISFELDFGLAEDRLFRIDPLRSSPLPHR